MVQSHQVTIPTNPDILSEQMQQCRLKSALDLDMPFGMDSALTGAKEGERLQRQRLQSRLLDLEKMGHDLSMFQFGKEQPAPVTVNPSLWQQFQLPGIGGLFEVTPGIYQVRGADLSNITFIESKTGIVVMDPCMPEENGDLCKEFPSVLCR